MNLQWYPGHMTKAKRQMEEDIKLVDVVLELVDARIPLSSKNPEIDKLAKNKPRVMLFNKSDLADPLWTAAWEAHFTKQGLYVQIINAKDRKTIKEVEQIVREACQEKIERDKRRGFINRPIRAMVVGIPNVGKSTLINTLSGKASTKTGNKPGVTKGKQWIRFNKSIELLDTPGILWPKFEDPMAGMRLAWIGSIKDELVHKTEAAMAFIDYMEEHYASVLEKRYQVESCDDSVKMLLSIAEKRCIKSKGDVLDIDKTAKMLLDEYRNGKIGCLTLEHPAKDMEQPQ